MKYLYILLFTFSVSFGYSQSFNWVDLSDSTLVGEIDEDIDFHSQLQNNTSSDITVRWRIPSFTSTSSEWDAYLCEEIICWPSWTLVPTNDVTVPANGTFELYAHVQMFTEVGSGEYTLCTHEVGDSANTFSCRTYYASTPPYKWEWPSSNSITGERDTEVEFASNIENMSNQPVDIGWYVNDFTSNSTNWDANICEDGDCKDSWTIDNSGSFTVNANSSFELSAKIQMNVDTGSATLELCTYQVGDSANTITCRTYKATGTPPLGIENLNAAEALSQNRPNPFKDNTMISYELQSENGSIKIHDLTGKLVQELPLSSKTGTITLDGSLRSGVYFYSLWDNGMQVDTKRMQVIE